MPKAAEPERSCIVTREVQPKETLIRFVISPNGEVVPDFSGKLPGRGLYVSASRTLLGEAIERRLFSKAAKRPVSVQNDFEALVEKLMFERLLQLLSLCRKAGEAIAGFEKIEEALMAGKVAALLHAEDASDDGVHKLKRRAEGLPSIRFFSRDALSQVMGRDNAVHVAVLNGNTSAFFVSEARRFALFLDKTPL